MIFKQYYLGCLAHASYMIGDETTGTGIVVDPQRDIDQYLEDAQKLHLTIRHVFLTHFHADFVAGHLELRDRVGAEIHLGARAQAEFEFTPAKEGQPMNIGSLRLEFLETPGHTPEGLSILIYDLPENTDRPRMVLTGDTLFIGDVGRPDLMASEGVSERELAEMLYDSLRNKLMPLPDETRVYPAHGAGSLCGKRLSEETVSTIGDQKLLNYALQPMDRDTFVALVTENQPQAPQYFSYDARLNKKERQNLDESLKTGLKALALEEVLLKQKEGCQVLDTRAESDYNAAHLKGAVQVSLGGRFATWAGVVLRPDIPIVLITEPGTEYESEMRLGRIGFDDVAGYLKDGMNAVRDRTELLESTPNWTVQELLEHLKMEDSPRIVDVRSPAEFKNRHIRGAVNIPLNHLERDRSQIPSDRPVLLHCKSGYRSSIGCSLLKRQGYDQVINLIGGFDAIERFNGGIVEYLVQDSG